MRADIETSMGTQANDLSALSKKLGGENDFNRAKMNDLFGETPTDAVTKRIEDEKLYSQNNSDIWRGSQTAGRAESAKFLDPRMSEAIPTSTSLTGILANLAARGLDRVLLPNSSIPKVAEVLTRKGPAARKVARELQNATSFRLLDYLASTAAKTQLSGR